MNCINKEGNSEYTEPYTRTVVMSSNFETDIKLLFEHLPITDYYVKPKKRGRKKKDEIVEPIIKLPPGSIITLKLPPDNIRGINIKGTNPFGNSLTIVLMLDKIINIKFPSLGKIQITGCKKPEHPIKAMQYLFKYIHQIEREKKIQIIKFKQGYDHPIMILYEVMINIKFDLNFSLNREKLDIFLNENTDQFFSFVESSLGYAGATVSFPVNIPDNFKLTQLRYFQGKWRSKKVAFDKYLCLLSPKDIIKEQKTLLDKKITFLVFDSGIVILSSPFIERVQNAYDEFYMTLHMNRNEFEIEYNK